MRRAAIALCLSIPACDSGESPVAVTTPPAGKADRADAPSYVTTDGEPLPAREAGIFASALSELARLSIEGTSGRQRDLARETLARIGEGDVLLGLIASARGEDLWHMCMDYLDVNACGVLPSDPAWSGTPDLKKLLLENLDGYQWGNRLYFAFPETPEPAVLAITLVHEVNHALNRSECSYYRDLNTHELDPTLSFVEEYRAFIAECAYRRGRNATADRCDTWAHTELVDRGYDTNADLSLVLDPGEVGTETIAKSLFADDGRFGWLTPKDSRWPMSFDGCRSF